MGGGAVEDYGTGARVTRDDVRFESLPVGEIAAQHALVRMEPDLVHQVAGNGQTAFIFEAGRRDLSAMNLRFQQVNLHTSGQNKRSHLTRSAMLIGLEATRQVVR